MSGGPSLVIFAHFWALLAALGPGWWWQSLCQLPGWSCPSVGTACLHPRADPAWGSLRALGRPLLSGFLPCKAQLTADLGQHWFHLHPGHVPAVSPPQAGSRQLQVLLCFPCLRGHCPLQSALLNFVWFLVVSCGGESGPCYCISAGTLKCFFHLMTSECFPFVSLTGHHLAFPVSDARAASELVPNLAGRPPC